MDGSPFSVYQERDGLLVWIEGAGCYPQECQSISLHPLGCGHTPFDGDEGLRMRAPARPWRDTSELPRLAMNRKRALKSTSELRAYAHRSAT